MTTDIFGSNGLGGLLSNDILPLEVEEMENPLVPPRQRLAGSGSTLALRQAAIQGPHAVDPPTEFRCCQRWVKGGGLLL